MNLWVRLLYGARLTDEATCYKATFTRLLRSMDLQCERFEFCPELTAKVCRLGLSIREVPISYYPRSKANGKKIRWIDGVAAVRTLWKWRHWSGALQGDKQQVSSSLGPGESESRTTRNVIRGP